MHHLVLQTTAHLLLVHLWILYQFILRVWIHQIRLILDLRLEMYHLDCVTLQGEHHDVVRHFVIGVLLHYLLCIHRLHSSSHSAGPSRKIYRSPVDFVPSSMPVIGSLAPTRVDLLPPRKRFRDSYSSKASIEEDTEIDPIETELMMTPTKQDTKIAALRLKFNAFKSLEGEKVMGTFTRLKCLLNDLENNGVIIPQVEVNATFVNSLPRKWLSMNQTQRANNSIKNDSLATLYGKYNYEEEEPRISSELLADLNAEYHKRDLLANQKRFYKRSGEDKYPGIIVKALGGTSRRKENNSSKEVLFSKADVSTSKLPHIISSDFEDNSDIQEALPLLPNLTRADPSKMKKSSNKVSQTNVIKKKTKSQHAAVQNSCPDKISLPSTKKLLLTLTEEIKGIKNQIMIPSYTSSSSSQACSSKTPKQKDYLNKSIWVAYVNGLKHNLVSISQLCDANFKVLFTKTQGTIFNQKDEVVLIAPRRIDVYVIDMSSFNKDCNACFFAKASPSVNWLWQRLSYLNFKNINNLVKHNLVSGIPSLTFSKDKNCSAYEYSRYTWVFCLKKKSDAADCIISFIRKMKNLNEVSVKEPRSDNGTEFRNHKLEEFCDEKGISQNYSSPCTLNRMVSIIVKRHGKTTYDVFRGRSPNISYFHVFGCPVHIHNHRDHLGKFDEQADDVFFLDDEAISQTSTEGDAINFNENRSFPDDDFIEPSSEEEGWVNAIQEELNQFERNKTEAIRIFLAVGIKILLEVTASKLMLMVYNLRTASAK
ncbi:retrovirus-related pol polyprotein from transposon TNT 1-94 [Tanacetum coccineum]